MKNPGRAGLTGDRLGDAESWVPGMEQGGVGENGLVKKVASSS